jgi:hypothetical protein
MGKTQAKRCEMRRSQKWIRPIHEWQDQNVYPRRTSPILGDVSRCQFTYRIVKYVTKPQAPKNKPITTTVPQPQPREAFTVGECLSEA